MTLPKTCIGCGHPIELVRSSLNKHKWVAVEHNPDGDCWIDSHGELRFNARRFGYQGGYRPHRCEAGVDA